MILFLAMNAFTKDYQLCSLCSIVRSSHLALNRFSNICSYSLGTCSLMRMILLSYLGRVELNPVFVAFDRDTWVLMRAIESTFRLDSYFASLSKEFILSICLANIILLIGKASLSRPEKSLIHPCGSLPQGFNFYEVWGSSIA